MRSIVRGIEIRHRQKWQSYRHKYIQSVMREQKDCSMQLDKEAAWFQAETARWFEESTWMSGMIVERDKKSWWDYMHRHKMEDCLSAYAKNSQRLSCASASAAITS